MLNYILFSYEALNSIYREGAFSSIVMNDLLPHLDNHDRAKVTKLVYGVLEKHQEFSYMLTKLCKKNPKAPIRICLRIGMYMIKYFDQIPNYAVVNEVVSLAKTVKKEQAGFVNATLKEYIKIKDDLPNGMDGLSIKYNLPIWLLKEYIDEYGLENLPNVLQNKYKHTHVRLNTRKVSKENFEKKCKDLSIRCTPTEHGYLIDNTSVFANEIKRGDMTLMALDSIKICKVLVTERATSDILDLCSAPGGKSVYLAENNPDITIFACDLHPHRVDLINAYKKRMGINNIVTEVYDGRVLREEWIGKFEYVLLDSPCSSLGVRTSNPDVILNRTEESLIELNEIQGQLLETASKYLKVGGRIVYSTCSNLKRENLDIVNKFLKEKDNFELCPSPELDGKAYHQFQNDALGNDGFFVCNVRRVK